ncbi:MAG TPA: argininosuccinate lyase, partial [Xanthomonadaceae bacterium]|nr:argininosuccinate lyase [Xanthomonadaceae bacterium]
GSSLMPNKRNPDVIELMRGVYASVAAAKIEIEQLLSLPSGYHRDLQFSKGAIVHGFGRGLAALGLLPKLLREVEWVPERMHAAIEPSMYATDLAVELAAQGLPFRDAYKAAANPQHWHDRDAAASLRARLSPGAAGDLQLGVLAARWNALKG